MVSFSSVLSVSTTETEEAMPEAPSAANNGVDANVKRVIDDPYFFWSFAYFGSRDFHSENNGVATAMEE